MNNPQIKTELGLRIKSFRTDMKMTQEELSSIIGLEQSNLSNIENGKAFPDITTLCAIINKTSVEPNFLLGFLQEEEEKYNSLDYEILKLLAATPKDVKLHLKNLLKSLQK